MGMFYMGMFYIGGYYDIKDLNGLVGLYCLYVVLISFPVLYCGPSGLRYKSDVRCIA